MLRKIRMVTRLGVLTIAGLLMVGCSLSIAATGKTTTGGGVGSSAIQPGAKVTYGFQLSCNSHTNTVYGQIDYADHGTSLNDPAGVTLHGTMPMEPVESYYAVLYNAEGIFRTFLPIPSDVTTCADLASAFNTSFFTVPPGVQVFNGSYTPEPRTAGQGGNFIVSTEATNAQIDCGPGEAAFGIALQGGKYDGYTNSVCTSLGDVTVH